MKNKKISIVFGIIFAYLFTGLVIYFIGGEVRGISFYEKITSAITVIIGWPIFLVGRFFN